MADTGSPLYGERMGEALRYAAETFSRRARKGRSLDGHEVPYLSHLLSVTALVMEHGGDEEECVAAVLHDTLEDIEGASVEELETRFGARVATLVVALSDAIGPLHKAPWRERKESYLEHLRGAPASVKLVSAADKLHNVRCLRSDFHARGAQAFAPFKGGVDGTLWYYRAAVEALSSNYSHSIVDQLARTVDGLIADVRRHLAAGA